MSTQDKTAKVHERISDLDKEIAELNKQRDSLSVDYSQNNKTAIKQVAQCDAAIDAAKREKGLLVSALAQLTNLAEEEQAAILEKVEAELKAKAASTGLHPVWMTPA
jgi:predicted  nucleic acid-binding Zn-ribbon protein